MDTMRYQQPNSSLIQKNNNPSNAPNGNTTAQENEAMAMASMNWKESIIQYFRSRYLLTELFGCILIFFFSPKIAEKVLRLKLNERPIPYQTLNNGEYIVLDLSLNNEFIPFSDQTIPGWLLGFSTVTIPIVLIIAVGFLHGPKLDVHAGLCAYLVAMGLNDTVTDTLKLYVGRFRPNFYKMCGFSMESLVCEGADDYNREGRRSFPSGHSSTTFCAFTIITLFFLGKTHLYHLSTLSFSKIKRQRLLSVMAVMPLSYAFFVAASRVVDNYHHPADVVAGSIIGFMCAIFSYSLWYVFFYQMWKKSFTFFYFCICVLSNSFLFEIIFSKPCVLGILMYFRQMLVSQ